MSSIEEQLEALTVGMARQVASWLPARRAARTAPVAAL